MKSKKLSFKLLNAVLCVSFVFSFIATGIQLYSNYRIDVGFLNKQLQNAETSILDSLGLAIWTIDRDQVGILLKGLCDLEDVVKVELKSPKSNIFVKLGDVNGSYDSKKTIKIEYMNFEKKRILGDLIVYSSYKRVKDDLWDSLLIVLLTQFVKTVFVSLLLLVIFHSLVVSPIHKLLFSLGEVKGDLSLGDQPYSLSLPKKDSSDEFKELYHSINLMLKKIHEFSLQKKKDDLSSQKRYEETLHANRLATLGGLSAELAHEVNNPNGAILFNANSLKRIVDKLDIDQSKDFDIFRDCISEISEASSRISNVVDHLKRYSNRNIQVNNVSFIPFKSIDSALKMLHYKFDRIGTIVEFTDLSEGQKIYGDPLTIEQVLVNILENSFHAIPMQDGKIQIKIFIENDKLIISVKDNGNGIDKDVLDKALQAFITSKKEQGGTGLGLYVSSRIMNEHGGKLELLSPANDGTEVRLIFPQLKDKL